MRLQREKMGAWLHTMLAQDAGVLPSRCGRRLRATARGQDCAHLSCLHGKCSHHWADAE